MKRITLTAPLIAALGAWAWLCTMPHPPAADPGLPKAQGERSEARTISAERKTIMSTEAASESNVRVAAGEPGDRPEESTVDSEPALLPIRLVDPEGVTITSGAVTVRPVDDSSTVTGEPDPRVLHWLGGGEDLELEAGTVIVQGFAGLHGGLDSVPIDSDGRTAEFRVVLEAGPNPPLKLVVQPSGAIRVTVTGDLTSLPTVRILRFESLDEATKALFEDHSPGEMYEQMFNTLLGGDIASNLDGKFSSFGLAPGKYAVSVGSLTGGVYAYELVEVAREVVEVELTVETPFTSRLRVTPIGPAGSPVTGSVNFDLVRELDGVVQIEEGFETRNDSGTRTVSFPDEAFTFYDPQSSEATYTLVVSHSEHGEKRVQLARGQLDVSVTYAESVSVLAQIDGYEACDMQGRLILRGVNFEDIESGASRTAAFNRAHMVDENGEGRIGPLQPGRYRVTLNAVPPDSLPWVKENQLAGCTVDVQAIDSPVALTVPEVQEVQISAPGLDPGVELVLTPVGQEDYMAWGPFYSMKEVLDEEQRCKLSYVPVGTYTLTVAGVDGSMQVSVPCGEIEFRPDR